jgi:hypothetical protein
VGPKPERIPEPTEPIGSVGSGWFYARVSRGLPHTIFGMYHIYGTYMWGSGLGSVLLPPTCLAFGASDDSD